MKEKDDISTKAEEFPIVFNGPHNISCGTYIIYEGM
jgi:hypothetical protein